MIELYVALDAWECASLALAACALAVLLRLGYRIVAEARATRQLAEQWQRDRSEFARIDECWTQGRE